MFLYTLLASSLATISIYALELSDLIPQESVVQVKQLSNGVVTYLQENYSNSSPAAIRVILEKDASWSGSPDLAFGTYAHNPYITPDHITYPFEWSLENLEELDNFLASCLSKANRGNSLGVVAVGAFPASEMSSLIERHFALLSFDSLEEEQEIKPAELQVYPVAGLQGVSSSISFTSHLKPIRTVGELKEQWILSLLQHMLQTRLEKCAATSAFSLYTQPEFLLPLHYYTVTAAGSPLEGIEGLTLLIEEIERTKKEGFQPEELLAAKEAIAGKLTQLASLGEEGSNSALATYYTEQFLHQAGAPSYPFFFSTSLQLLKEISLADVEEQIPLFFSDNSRKINVAYAEEMEEPIQPEKIATLLGKAQPLSVSFAVAREEGYRSLRPASNQGQEAEAPDLYATLHISEKEKGLVHKIVSTLANHNVVKLLLKKKTLQKAGKNVEHVHPFRFLGTIISDPYLKSCMHEIKKSGFKWDGFLDGYSKKMKSEANAGNLLPYVPSFARAMGVDQGRVTDYIHQRNWEGLLRYLIQ